MNTEIDFNPHEYWNKLSIEERLKFLSENYFWDGFSHYLYEYLPKDVQEKILLKSV